MENGLYLLEKGKVNLARNFIYLLNNFDWQSSCRNSSYTDTSLHTQTYDNIVKSNSTSKMTLKSDKQCISTASSNKISLDLSLHAYSSKVLLEPDTLRNVRKRNHDRLLISDLNIKSL